MNTAGLRKQTLPTQRTTRRFNAGVAVLNLRQWRCDRVTGRVRRIAKENHRAYKNSESGAGPHPVH